MQFNALLSGTAGLLLPLRRRKLTLKTLLVMQLTGFLLCCCMFQAVAGTFGQNISLSFKEAPIQQVFKEIKKQTRYTFLADSDLLKKANKVTIDVKDVSLEEALNTFFKGQPFSWSISGKIITVQPLADNKNEAAPRPVFTNEIPPITVRGRVTNENGEPVAGATVAVKGTQWATSTDENGNYALYGIESNARLIVSGSNIETYEVNVNQKAIVNITAELKVKKLADVVVNKGYYTQKQILNTGNVSSVSGADIRKQPVTDPILALQGRVPGLSITQTSGIPGSNTVVQLRGQNGFSSGAGKLITANNPLYIIDGVPYGSGALGGGGFEAGAIGSAGVMGSNGLRGGYSPFNMLSTSDIESIEILKDADATAIYGARGANGVILITTKKGKAQSTRVDFNLASGSGKVANKIDLLNTRQYLLMRHEAYKNDGTVPSSTHYDVNGVWDSTHYTDWQKVLIGNTAHYTNAQVNVSGGNANTQFLIGSSYSRQTTVYPGTSADQKVGVNANISHTSDNQLFHVEFGVNFVNDNSGKIPGVDLTKYITLAPDAPPLYDASGNLNWQVQNGRTTFDNPLAYTLREANAVTDNLISHLSADYHLSKELQLKVNFGYNNIQMNQTVVTPANSYGPPNNTFASRRSISFAAPETKTWIIEPQLSYEKRFGRSHLNMIVGTTFQETEQNSLSQNANGFSSDALIYNPIAATNFSILDDKNVLYRYNAVYGRIGYDWGEKYLLNLTGRRDGSSRFGPGKQFGNFGAIGAGWIFSKGKWTEKHLPWLSFGKLRGSYGVTGNDQITDYQFLRTYSSITGTYLGASGLAPTQLSNPKLAWEQVRKLEAGLELGLIKDRINLSASYYRNRTDNQLVGYGLPYFTGFSSVTTNLPALIENKGVELVLNTVNVKSESFSWNSSFNISFPSNTLLAYPGIESTSYAGIYTVGQSLFSRKMYHYTGVDPQTGIYTFEDVNKDGTVDLNDVLSSNAITKSITQKYFGGFSNILSYKGWQLDFIFQFVKQLGYNYQSSFNIPGGFASGNNNQPVYVMDRWQDPANNTSIQKFTANGGSSTANAYGLLRNPSDGVITDASFIRLKNLALSYTFPRAWQQQIHMKDLKIYFQCQNLLTITSYKGLDPETQSLSLPPLRMITLGIKSTL